MVIERKLQHWLRQGLALYAAQPALIEQAFLEDAQEGIPSTLAAGQLVDSAKHWLTDEWAGGVLRYAGTAFPIVSNTETALTVTGNPSVLMAPVDTSYQIVPSDVARVTQYLTTKMPEVEVSYSRIPVNVPAITIRLQSETEQRAFVGESLRSVVNALGEERCEIASEMAATYLVTIWSQNPQETIWLYHVLTNLYRRSQPQWATWGLFEVKLSGSDLHPDLEYVPEQIYTRYLTISLTHIAQAVLIKTVEPVTAVTTVPSPGLASLITEGS